LNTSNFKRVEGDASANRSFEPDVFDPEQTRRLVDAFNAVRDRDGSSGGAGLTAVNQKSETRGPKGEAWYLGGAPPRCGLVEHLAHATADCP